MRKKCHEVLLAALDRNANPITHFNWEPIIASLLFASYQQIMRVNIVFTLIELSKIIIIISTSSYPTQQTSQILR